MCAPLNPLGRLLLPEFSGINMFWESLDSPSCAKTLGRTFSCQAAAAAAMSAASRAQRSTSMALVTSRHHLENTRELRRGTAQAGKARGGRRRTGSGRRGGPARLRFWRPAVSHAWGCGVRTSHVTQPSSPQRTLTSRS